MSGGARVDSLESLVYAMRATLSPEVSDSERKAATAAIREYQSQPECFMGFVSVVSNAEDEALRMQAAVLLLQSMSHWTNLGQDDKNSAKDALLNALFSDPMPLVRRNLGVAVAVTARRELTTGGWDAFLPIMHQAAESDEPRAREVAFSVFKRLVRFFGLNEPAFFSQLAPLWVNALTDAGSNEVRIDAFASLAAMTAYFEEEGDFASFEPIFPQMLQTVVTFVEANDESKAVVALGVLEDMLQITPTFVATLWPQLVQFNVQLIQAGKEDITKRALSSLAKYVELKPMLLLKHELVSDVLNAAFTCIAEEETDIDEGNSIPSNAQTLVDTICLRIGPSHTFPLCMEAASQYLADSVTSPHTIRGGLMILAMSAEGCQAYMREELETLMNAMMPHLSSSAPLVRDAALMVLYQFAEHMRPNIHDYHRIVIAGSLDGLSEDLLSSRMNAARALNSFVVFLENEVLAEYLENIMSGYVGTIVGEPESLELPLMCASLTGIGMLAVSVGPAFAPYFEPTMDLMIEIIGLTDNDSINLRARAIEAIGGVAQACGLEAFAPYLDAVMTNAFEGLKLEFCRLREHTYSFFGRVATLMGQEFGKYVDDVLPILYAICKAPDMAVFTGDVFVDTGDDDYDDDFEVPQDAQDEKGSAAYCIGVIATAMGPAFLPFVQDSFSALETLLQYDNEDVRASVVTAMSEVARVVPATLEWRYSVGLPITDNVPEPIAQVAAFIVPKFLLRMFHEEAVEVVSRAMTSFASLTRAFGPIMFANEDNYELFSSIARLTLERELICQQPLDEDDFGDDVEARAVAALVAEDKQVAGDALSGHGANVDDLLDAESPIDMGTMETDHLAEALEAASEVLGAAFEPCFKGLLEGLESRARPQRPVYERCTALGVLSASAAALGPRIAPYLESPMLPLFLAGCKDESEDVRRNAVFGLGLILEVMGSHNVAPGLAAVLPHALEAINNVFDAGYVEDAAAPDNAVAALGRLISAMPQPSDLPLSALIPAMVAHMPLTADASENPAVYSALFALFSASDEAVFGELPNLIRSALPDHIAFQLGLLLNSLINHDQIGSEVSAMLASLDDDERANLMGVVQQAVAAQ
ncbi:HEAT repeat family protein [Thecamonas trahens ATCC 50062]|uniref:HEAT repeat family protein n=1 Tax=Thecamonas trahens ATCC 50062 TaxID=461836 RepID=A0A0L0DRZ9_THETB|nr:HEAT repeat family protein [Thecamonas trahens ATCC 50062]KNC54208.1 HEAT repeat family protein [Thecamonas trahens ATCC 50062]|eukprot:XP_013753848.1 HEAT repeat family protein [Thecamonas trahens ATCC 50062]